MLIILKLLLIPIKILMLVFRKETRDGSTSTGREEYPPKDTGYHRH